MVKAVALAARAVMIGRAYLWGLAANGQAGVENVLTSCAAASTPRCSAWARPASAT
jgi:L-lactate dehydrogenase (cytochrome)